jgi:hypothetical protein
VRDIDLVNTGHWYTALGGIVVQDNNLTPFLVVSGAQALAGVQTHWQGRQVIDASHLVRIIPQELGWSARVSGYSLTAT